MDPECTMIVATLKKKLLGNNVFIHLVHWPLPANLELMILKFPECTMSVGDIRKKLLLDNIFNSLIEDQNDYVNIFFPFFLVSH